MGSRHDRAPTTAARDLYPRSGFGRDQHRSAYQRASARSAPDRAQGEEIVRGFISDWERHGIGYWVVGHRGEVIGIAGVRPIRLCGRDCWNLYYRFSPDSWGKGLAAEAARQALMAARECDPTRPIVARIRPEHGGAARPAQTIGMTRSSEWDGDGFVAFVSS